MRLPIFVLASFALGGCATVEVQSSRRASFADPALCTSQRYQPQIAAAFVQSLGVEGETIPLRVYASHEGQRGPDGSRQCHMTIATSSIGTPNTGIYAIASDGSDAFSLDAARRAGVAKPDQPNHPTNEVCQTLENAGIPNKAILRSIMGPTGFPLNNLQISNIALVNDLVINRNRHAVVCEINGSSDDGYLVGRLFVDYNPVVEQANSYNFETMHQIVKQYINDNFKAFYEPLVGKVPFPECRAILAMQTSPADGETMSGAFIAELSEYMTACFAAHRS